MKKRLKILVLFDTAGTPPDDQDFRREFRTEAWKTEAQVVRTLKRLGHDVHMLGIYEELDLLYEAVKKVEPEIIFNLMEHFGGKGPLDHAVAGLFEMMGVPYTGCGPDGLMLARRKGISKGLLSFHGVKNPPFTVVKRGKKLALSADLNLPCIVKMANDDASVGISRASYVETEEALCERVRFVHDRLKDDALVERFIQGRELYVGMMGNSRLEVFPIREMVFGRIKGSAYAFATYKAKWDEKYRERYGINNRFAGRISPELLKEISSLCERAYKILKLDGYARIDLRLTEHNEVFFIEANPNPHLAQDEDFAMSAKKAGYGFDRLIDKILTLGLRRSADARV